MINSGLEATPFGFHGYGFDQYSGSPNSVAGLAGSWTNHTRQILEFEESHSDVCFRVYYEQLVLEPERVADAIFKFVGVPSSPGITDHAFARRDEPGQFEFGDYKIHAVRRVTDASVGRGMRVPPALIAPDQRSAMNEVLTRLGYTAVDRSWEMSTIPPVLLVARPCQPPVADVPADDGAHGSETRDPCGACIDPVDETDEDVRLLSFNEVDCEFKRRIGQNVKILPGALTAWNSMAIVAYSLRRPRMAVAWRVDRVSGEVDSDIDDVDFQSLDVECAFTGEIDTWRSVLTGTENLANAVRECSIRHITRHTDADNSTPVDMTQAEIRGLALLAHILGLWAGLE